MNKICLDCNEPKDLQEFHKRRKTHASYCKECQGKRQKKWYDALSNEKKKVIKVASKLRRVEFQKKVHAYLLEHGCIECPESDPAALQFDHVRGKKKANVSRAITNGWSWGKILAEIAKCEVRCANCHAKKTAKQLGYYKFLRA